MTHRLMRVSQGLGDDDEVVPHGLRLKQLEEELREVQSAICRGLNQLLDFKGLGVGHTNRVSEIAERLTVELGMSEEEQQAIRIACALHDIGKLGVPDDLLRHVGPLSAEQWADMRRHPEYGWAVLRLLPGFEDVSLYVLHHHERWDGSGYPGGLSGTQIPMGARVVGIVDAFDAMVTPRPHEAAVPAQEALCRLRAAAGSQFDPDLVETFCRVIETDIRLGGPLPSLAGLGG